MAEGKDQGEGEDLFEDLDKFFAPIQDVDWPETTEPAREPEARPSQAEPFTPEPEPFAPDVERFDEPVASAPELQDTAAFDEPIRIDPLDEPAGEPAAVGPGPGQEDLFGDEAETARPATRSPQAEDEDGVSSFLFESEAEEDLEPRASDEPFAQAPAAYEGLPGPDDEDDAVAELLEDDAARDEPAPDLDAVEAAADHFAASVRGEVRVEPDPGTMTEEVDVATLLGDDDSTLPEIGQPEPARTVRVGPEGLGGPSWQEPTAMEVGAEPERRGPGRDVPMAFLTGLVLAALALGSIALGPGPFAIFAGAVVLVAQGELYFALQKRHYQPATALGLVGGALVLGAGYYRGEGAMLAMLALSTFATFLWYMTVPAQHRRNVVSNVALTVLGVVYVPLLAAYALSVLRLPEGRGLVLTIIGLTIAYDIGAFAIGSMWGMRPLAPSVSPKKSWEGAIGATVLVIAIAVGAVSPSIDLLDTLGRSVGLALVVAIFAPLGDLAESVIKRDLGIKDMGSILPGHGGVLDRIDSMLFVAPAAFMYLRVILL